MTFNWLAGQEVPRRAPACARSMSAIVTFIASALLSACASMPESGASRAAGTEALYEGQPETVYATEFPVTSTADARSRAEQALAEGDTDRALYMYVQAVTLDPGDSESLYRIGVLHERRGNRRLAARAFAGAIENEPEHAGALQGLGIAYFEARETEAARAMLQRAVAADAQLWRAHNVLGVIADMAGEHATAVGHYSAALAVRPDAASLLNNRGYSKYLAGDYASAEADFRAALAADAEYGRAWQNLGLLYARQQHYALALRALARVKEQHVAANDVGYIAMLDGDYETAERLFSRAKRESPRYYATAEKNLAELRRRAAQGGTASASTRRRVPLAGAERSEVEREAIAAAGAEALVVSEP